MGWMTWAGIVAAPFTGGASLVLTAYDMQQEQQKKAQAVQEKAIKAQKKAAEAQAGEYAEQTAAEMKINVLMSQMQSLDQVIANQSRQPNIMTLPSAENPSPMARINKAIDDLLKGKW